MNCYSKAISDVKFYNHNDSFQGIGLVVKWKYIVKIHLYINIPHLHVKLFLFNDNLNTII